MRVGVIARDPRHPLLTATAALLTAAGHWVEFAAPDPADPADVYLLKARTPAALALARRLETAGAVVLNSAAATERCQDRVLMAELALAAGLPFAPSLSPNALRYPLVVKSRHSRKDDLVAKVPDPAGLAELRRQWPDEPLIHQEFAPGDGWDRKLWVVGRQVFGELRRSELVAGSGAESWTVPLELAELALWVGEVFALDVYGVDVLEVDGAPLVVDVNAFPGIRGQQGAPEAVVRLVQRQRPVAGREKARWLRSPGGWGS